uniref:Bifunctional apoptosis regulator-like isoform X1 n=1 Tax=Pogona vitticeps TaxID=103695 RepID=A0ABM5F181_9SAUR
MGLSFGPLPFCPWLRPPQKCSPQECLGQPSVKGVLVPRNSSLGLHSRPRRLVERAVVLGSPWELHNGVGGVQRQAFPPCVMKRIPPCSLSLFFNRDAIEKLFPDAIKQRKADIQQNPDVSHSLAAFQKYGTDQTLATPSVGRMNPRGGGFFSGVLTALTCVAVVLLGYHWSSRDSEDDLLVHKPVAKWTAEEVTHWLEQLGPWTSLYKDRFLLERVNGRLLLMLTEEDLSKAPYRVENSSHRKAIMTELERVKMLGMKPPQNLWEYKAVHPGKSLFLLYALKSSPRLTMLYLYLFDYTEAFLPFLHTICPVQDEEDFEEIMAKLLVSFQNPC